MLYAIVVALIIGLVVIVLVSNSIQQQKKKQDEERRRELTKLRAIIDATEEVIFNSTGAPLSIEAFNILYGRELVALKSMLSLAPDNREIKKRIQSVKDKLENTDYNVIEISSIELPEDDKALIAFIQGIKKYRIILRSELSKGRISNDLFSKEDKKFEKLQLKITIDTQIRRGKLAISKDMTGSARQYFEKAQKTLDAQKIEDEYITTKKAEVQQYLETIATNLKSANLDAVKKKQEEEDNDDLDALFAPKKKW